MVQLEPQGGPLTSNLVTDLTSDLGIELSQILHRIVPTDPVHNPHPHITNSIENYMLNTLT